MVATRGGGRPRSCARPRSTAVRLCSSVGVSPSDIGRHARAWGNRVGEPVGACHAAPSGLFCCLPLVWGIRSSDAPTDSDAELTRPPDSCWRDVTTLNAHASGRRAGRSTHQPMAIEVAVVAAARATALSVRGEPMTDQVIASQHCVDLGGFGRANRVGDTSGRQHQSEVNTHRSPLT